MRSAHLMWVLAFATQSPSAQTSASLQTATDVTLRAWPNPTVSIPANTAITTSRSLSATSGSVAAAALTVAPTAPFGVNLDASAIVSGSIAEGQGAFDWTLNGSGYGRLTITVTQFVFYTGSATASARLTISGRNVFEGHVDNSIRSTSYLIGFADAFSLRMSFSARSVDFWGSPSESGRATIQLRIGFVPLPLPPLRQYPYGVPCGATLAVTDTPGLRTHLLGFDGSGAAPNGPCLLLLGAQQTDVPLPGSPCNLLVVPDVVLVVLADPGGAIRLTTTIPGPTILPPVFLQMIAIDPWAPARATDGLEITAVDL